VPCSLPYTETLERPSRYTYIKNRTYTKIEDNTSCEVASTHRTTCEHYGEQSRTSRQPTTDRPIYLVIAQLHYGSMLRDHGCFQRKGPTCSNLIIIHGRLLMQGYGRHASRCGEWHSFGFIFVSGSQDVPHAWTLSHGVVIFERWVTP
jgi:hypothetical protein